MQVSHRAPALLYTNAGVEQAIIPKLLQTSPEPGEEEKVLVAVCYLQDEVLELVDTLRLECFPVFAGFGNGFQEGDGQDSESIAHLFVEKLPFFKDTCHIVRRLCRAVRELALQLQAVYNPAFRSFKKVFRQVDLQSCFKMIGKAFQTLVVLDLVVDTNAHLAVAWSRFCDVLHTIRTRAATLEVDMQHARDLETKLVDLKNMLFDGSCFEYALEQNFSPLCNNQTFLSKLANATATEITSVLQLAEAYCKIAPPAKARNAPPPHVHFNKDNDILAVACLYVFYTRVLPPRSPPQPELFKQIWSVQRWVPVVCPHLKAVWTLDTFLLTHCSFSVQASLLHPKDPAAFRVEYVADLDRDLAATLSAEYQQRTHIWSESFLQQVPPTLEWREIVAGSDFEMTVNNLSASKDTAAAAFTSLLRCHASLIKQGVQLAEELQRTLLKCLNMHVSLKIPMTKGIVKPVLLCAQLLKLIEQVFGRRAMTLLECTPHIVQVCKHPARDVLVTWNKRLESSASTSPKERGMLTTTLAILNKLLAMGNGLSATRLHIVETCIDVMKGFPKVAKPREVPIVEDAVSDVFLIGTWQSTIRRCCDCSMLYWYTGLLPGVLADMVDNDERLHELGDIFRAYSDCCRPETSALDRTPRNMLGAAQQQAFEAALVRQFNVCFALPVCRQVENELRLHQYSTRLGHMKDAMALGTTNSSIRTSVIRLRPLSKYVQLEPFVIGASTTVSMRKLVTEYLQEEIYNMTVLNLHDWTTYSDIKVIACENYGITLDDTYLPMGRLNIGLDAINIMKNIHGFVEEYVYNLNQQFFIERRASKGAKHFAVVNIDAIASSLQTHGSGMVNTCVNYIYQFLVQQVSELFHVVFGNDMVKSYLTRERRWFNDAQQTQGEYTYSYERAKALTKKLHRLGKLESGLGFLDTVREMVARIGNAIGFVRMVRSAEKNFVATAYQFTGDLEDSSEDGAGASIVDELDSESTSTAAKQLFDHISNLKHKAVGEKDYLKILVQVFHSSLKDDAQIISLRDFPMLVPALSINFVETISRCKDNITRAASRGRDAYFTDDGFALGASYLMAILKETKTFQTFQWFEQVNEHFAETKNVRGMDEYLHLGYALDASSLFFEEG